MRLSIPCLWPMHRKVAQQNACCCMRQLVAFACSAFVSIASINAALARLHSQYAMLDTRERTLISGCSALHLVCVCCVLLLQHAGQAGLHSRLELCGACVAAAAAAAHSSSGLPAPARPALQVCSVKANSCCMLIMMPDTFQFCSSAAKFCLASRLIVGASLHTVATSCIACSRS
jgi:hypothetical protein